jgi:N-acyl-phosphatidylethanolamine-hydrolysing phospholipase D
MGKNSSYRLIRRRNFLKKGLALCLPLIPGFPQKVRAATDMQKHHTSGGFQNFPSSPKIDPLKIITLGPSFGLRRIRGAYCLPDVSQNHCAPMEKALAQLLKFKNNNTLTWVGHSTFLLNIDGVRILTDPFFAEHAGPVEKMGPKRFAGPGIPLRNLPKIDAIVVSHNHYDHLDADAVDSLPEKDAIRVFVPLGLKSFFTGKGYRRVYELDWNQKAMVSGIQITALPAVHFSGRWLWDHDKTLWCSWAIQASCGNYYFSGDTAYSPTVFKQIGNLFKSFNLAMVPIGAYQPAAFMQPYHTNPEEAVKVGSEIHSKILVGMHWGTIALSDEPPWEPPVLFQTAARNAGYHPDQTWLMKIGETRILP